MTVKPAKHYIIDYRPLTHEKDLVQRLRAGISLAREDGFDFAFIVEDDDYYNDNYFEAMSDGTWDFIGDDRTIYYHIRSNGYAIENHHWRASLFTTGFRISALDGFDWTRLKPGTVFADIALWEFARRRSKTHFVKTGAIGIKHGIGLTGGIGHRQRYKNFDKDWSFLASKVDAHSLEFYKSLQLQIA
jgi:hypothetical protein